MQRFAPLYCCLISLSGCQEKSNASQEWPLATTESSPENLGWLGEAECCGEDPHAVDGAGLPDGRVALVGKSFLKPEEENTLASSPFLVVVQPARGRQNTWAEPDAISIRYAPASQGAFLQVVTMQEKLYVVGHEGSPPQAKLWVFSSASGELLTSLLLDAATAGEASAFESITPDSQGGLYLGGVQQSNVDAFEGFKSYGNVTRGQAVLVHLSASSLDSTLLPERPDDIFSFPDWVSFKSLKALSTGSVVGVTSTREEVSAVIQIAANGAEEWRYLEPGPYEITDVAIDAQEEPNFLLSGHGGDDTIDGHVTRLNAKGEPIWSRSFGNSGYNNDSDVSLLSAPRSLIYDECWGIQVDAQGRAYLACGTGIEGCDSLSGREKRDCENDPRVLWRSLCISFSPNGDELWRRTESFVEQGTRRESAAEYLLFNSEGELEVVQDHDFGIGLLSLSSVD
ncbi:MAG: hypothetical protein MK135_01545 [Polyangiaceae bacterium]|nr:hypothetical protein [Polyangiaceae bacterium]